MWLKILLLSLLSHLVSFPLLLLYIIFSNFILLVNWNLRFTIFVRSIIAMIFYFERTYFSVDLSIWFGSWDIFWNFTGNLRSLITAGVLFWICRRLRIYFILNYTIENRNFEKINIKRYKLYFYFLKKIKTLKMKIIL